jgi:hypothetical protein
LPLIPSLLHCHVVSALFRVEDWKRILSLTIPDSAAIYVLHKDEYLPSAEAIRSGEGVNDNVKIHFEPGKTYKIRIVNMSALASESPLSRILFAHELVEESAKADD